MFLLLFSPEPGQSVAKPDQYVHYLKLYLLRVLVTQYVSYFKLCFLRVLVVTQCLPALTACGVAVSQH